MRGSIFRIEKSRTCLRLRKRTSKEEKSRTCLRLGKEPAKKPPSCMEGEKKKLRQGTRRKVKRSKPRFR